MVLGLKLAPVIRGGWFGGGGGLVVGAPVVVVGAPVVGPRVGPAVVRVGVGVRGAVRVGVGVFAVAAEGDGDADGLSDGDGEGDGLSDGDGSTVGLPPGLGRATPSPQRMSACGSTSTVLEPRRTAPRPTSVESEVIANRAAQSFVTS